MKNIPRQESPIKPAAIYAYFDRVQVWLKHSADTTITTTATTTIAKLRAACGFLYVEIRPARFDETYRQRVEMKQPTDAALRWIAGRRDALINQVEIAVDYVFDTEAERDRAYEFLHRHLVRRWHGKRQEIRVHPGRSETRYDASRRAPNSIVFYQQGFCRITGELNALHLEWRAHNLRAVRSAGIESGKDLVKFDHRKFWEKKLLLYDIEPERLGRLLRNRSSGRKSRAPAIANWNGRRFNLDERTGNVLINSVGTVQELIDRYGSWLRLHRVLSRVVTESLLPGNAEPSMPKSLQRGTLLM